MPEHILRLDLLASSLPIAKFIYVQRDWLMVSLSIHKICANSTRQSRWFGCQAAKWKALRAYAEQIGHVKIVQAMDYRQTVDQSKPGSSAFYKGVLEWLMCELALDQHRDKVTIVQYSHILTQPE